MRLVDLHCDWLWQYATETTLFPPAAYGDVPALLPALDGYLLGASAVILFCSRKPGDWNTQPDPWASVGDLVARYESEFAGRLIFGPDDLARFEREPSDGLCWGMLGLGGLDFLVRKPADVDRLNGAFERGVRVFQLVDGPDSRLGGSASAGDDRSLADIGLTVLNRLAEIAPPGDARGPRPVVDVAGMNTPTLAAVLDWFEQDAKRSERLILLSSCGSLGGLALERRETVGETAGAVVNLRRFRNLGGVIGVSPGPPAVASAEALRETIEAIAAVPFQGRPGYEGIGIGTSFLRLAALLPELKDVAALADWLERTFCADSAFDLGERAARRLLARAAGPG